MPCYDPPISNKDLAQYHERSAIRILKEAFPYECRTVGAEAVKVLCQWCKTHTPAEIDKIGASWWLQDHQRYDLRASGLAKLTEAEKKALGLLDGDLA